MLRELLPEDVHERCSAGGTAHIAVTRLFPAQQQPATTAAASSPEQNGAPPLPQPLGRLVRSELVSSFESRDDLIAAVLTSSHIPWYLDGKATRTFRGGECLDGGLTQFIPAIPGTVAAAASSGSSSCGSESDGESGVQQTTRLVRVTCFPSRAVDAAVQRAARLLPESGGGAAAGRSAEAEAAVALERAAAAGGRGGDGSLLLNPAPRFADLSPDRYDSDWGVSMREAIAMAFEPAPEPTLLALLEKGREDARRWMAANDVGPVVAAATTGSAARGGGGGF
jgi:hypothetical protein